MLAPADVARQNPSTRLPGAIVGQGWLPVLRPMPGPLPVCPGGRGDRRIGPAPQAARPKPGLSLPPEPEQSTPAERADPLRSPQPAGDPAGIDAPAARRLRGQTARSARRLATTPPAELPDCVGRRFQATARSPAQRGPPPPGSRCGRPRLGEVQQPGKSSPARTDSRLALGTSGQCRAHLGSAIGSPDQDRHRVHAAKT